MAKQRVTPTPDTSLAIIGDGIRNRRRQAQTGLREQGASGTVLWGNGRLVRHDYNPDLSGPAFYRTAARMRRNPTVNSVLQAIKLPLIRATWGIYPPDGGDASDTVIANFCHHAIFGDQTTREPWRWYLEHILNKVDYGNSVQEPIYKIATVPVGDETRDMVVLERLAPRLAETIQDFTVDDTGLLLGVSQRAYKNGSWQLLTIDDPPPIVYVRKREGDSYWGTAVLHSAYEPWFALRELQMITLIHAHRFGAGIPVFKANRKLTPDDERDVDEIGRALQVNEQAYVLEPEGIDFRIEMADGTSTNLEPLMSYYTIQIARNVLAGFLTTGDQKFGNFSTAAALLDVFMAAEESEAAEITSALNTSLIRPLCDQNFQMQGRKYPQAKVSKIASIDLSPLSEVFSNLVSAGVLHSGADDEDFFRALMGLPDAPKQFPGVDRDELDAADLDGDMPSADRERLGSRDLGGDRSRVAQFPRPRALALRDRVTRDRLATPMLGRRATPLEERILSLSTISERLDSSVALAVEQIRRIREKQLAFVLRKIKAADAHDAEFLGLRPDKITLPYVDQVERVIAKVQEQMVRYGSEEVRREFRRQGLALTSTPTPDVLLLDAAGASKQNLRRQLKSSASIVAAKINSNWILSVLDVANRWRRDDVRGEELAKAVEEEMHDRAELYVKREIGGEVNEAFSLGRQVEAEQQADKIARCVYSAILDRGTCGPCESADGTEFAYGSPEMREFATPFKLCEGKEQCRCVILYLSQ